MNSATARYTAAFARLQALYLRLSEAQTAAAHDAIRAEIATATAELDAAEPAYRAEKPWVFVADDDGRD